MHRCVDQMKKMLQSIGESQDNLKYFITQRAEVKLQVNQISRNVEETTHSVNAVSESQDSIKSILKDLYDIINEMNRADRGDPQDFELLQKINDISNGMAQVNLGQESVKEVMTEWKSTLERKPRNNKRGHYQTTDCATPHYEEKVKHPRLSSDLNFAYFDRQYETDQRWEILNCHLKVICTDNQEHISPPVLETDAYLLREEAYLTISIVSKLFKYMGFVSKQNPDYNSFQGFIATMFRGLVERKISPSMVYHWLTHQVYWSLKKKEERMAKLYTAFSPQEYECLKNALELTSVNKTMDLEKAMKVLQWFKQSTCPCNQHMLRRGGNQWQLRPATTVPTDVVLQLPTVSKTTILQKRAAKHGAVDQASLVVETSSISSDDTFLQDEPVNNEPIPKTTDDNFNQKMKQMFQNPIIQNLFTCEHTGLLSELCSKFLKEVKQANPLKWMNHVNSARSEVDELVYWKDQMKQDVDSMMSQIQIQLYTGLDEANCSKRKKKKRQPK